MPSAFNRMDDECRSLQGRCQKINLLEPTNNPLVGGIRVSILRIIRLIWLIIFPIERQVPSRGRQDTFVVTVNGRRSPHAADLSKVKSYRDSDVLRIHKLTAPVCLDTGISDQFFNDSPINLHRDEYGRYVLLQPGVRACTAAVTAMMILDSGKQCDISALRTRNIGTERLMVSDLQRAGLTPLVSLPKSRDELRSMIVNHGSAIVSVNSGNGGHVILVDEISRDTAKIRDPFHGWSITIPLSSLSLQAPIIQIQKS